MEQFNIAVISPNNFNTDGKYMTRDDVEKNVSSLIKIHSSSNETMMEQIVNFTNMTPKLMGDTSLCFEDENYVIQLCHVSPEDNDNMKMDINGVGSYLVADNRKIYGNIVVMKFKIMDDNTCTNYSINHDEIVDIISRKFNHIGVAIDVDNNKTEFSFKETPLEYVNENLHNNYKGIDVNLFGNVFIMYVELVPETNKPNKIATRLAGNCLVHGNAILVAKGSDLLFSDLTKEYVDKIEKLCWGEFSKRKLEGLELQNREKIDKLPIVMNGFRIVENRLKKYKKECIECKSSLETTLLVCTGCYRVAYDNVECQKKHWNVHTKECLTNKKPINEALRMGINIENK